VIDGPDVSAEFFSEITSSLASSSGAASASFFSPACGFWQPANIAEVARTTTNNAIGRILGLTRGSFDRSTYDVRTTPEVARCTN
jgi:hypothetical protein